MPKRRMDFGHFVDRVFWTLLTSAAIYASAQLRTLSDSVNDLNVKMAVIVEKESSFEKKSEEQNKKLEMLEHAVNYLLSK